VAAQALEVVALVQRDDQIVQGARFTYLASLARHQPGLRGGALHVHARLREVEVGREGLDDLALLVVLERERVRLVEPRNAARVEELREL